jgi:hypothetical protein
VANALSSFAHRGDLVGLVVHGDLAEDRTLAEGLSPDGNDEEHGRHRHHPDEVPDIPLPLRPGGPSHTDGKPYGDEQAT